MKWRSFLKYGHSAVDFIKESLWYFIVCFLKCRFHIRDLEECWNDETSVIFC
jgi:hypothetical protein